jgi:NAD+ synthase
MPNEYQSDISDSYEVVARLNLQYHVVNIGSACRELYRFLADAVFLSGGKRAIEENTMITTNTPARLRMTTLYAVAALYPNSRVVNTCNRSEDYIGYSTKYGDAAGDFSPLGNLTVREVLEIGDELGLPEHLVHKAPSDGMCGKTDEENIGFTYEELDDYILGTGPVSDTVVNRIIDMHNASRHKFLPIPTYDPHIYEWWELKQSKGCRGLRAKSGIMYDDCATGGIINPREFPPMPNEYTMSVDIAPPSGAVEINTNLAKELEMKGIIDGIENELLKSMMCKEIGGKV